MQHEWQRKGNTVVTAYAEGASGPGWANTPIWVIWRDASGDLHQGCLQPGDQTQAMRTLYRVSQAAHLGMVAVARRAG